MPVPAGGSIFPIPVPSYGGPTVSFAPLGPSLKVLLIWPKFPPSFWGFEGAMTIMPEAAMTPPLGLITIAALCPASWTLRLLDHAFDAISDEDLRWADLVMVSAMQAQRVDALAILRRARTLGIRTFIGGPWASSEPDVLRLHADHVMVGEAEEVFCGIAQALQDGTAQSLYRVTDKPDISASPIPRFDLLRRDKYSSMPVQFSRGCPFQCEFCDIITIYGRKPRTKSAPQLIAELDRLRELGWRGEVFVVDDNFIGNRKNALQLVKQLAGWGDAHGRPFSYFTQASVDLADRPELMEAMVAANFIFVFLGIETPSADALKESKKLQNLRRDNLEQVRIIQESGLWVIAGFIVGFDSDDETIFGRQREFIERAAIPWAMAGMLQAPPTTPLYERMKVEGRLVDGTESSSNFSAPNFRTVMPLPTLLQGFSGLLTGLYEPRAYFRRALHSLEVWKTKASQTVPETPGLDDLRMLGLSMWTQGVRSDYRRAYWDFLSKVVHRYWNEPVKLAMGFGLLVAAHHFLTYARQVAAELQRDAARASGDPGAVPLHG